MLQSEGVGIPSVRSAGACSDGTWGNPLGVSLECGLGNRFRTNGGFAGDCDGGGRELRWCSVLSKQPAVEAWVDRLRCSHARSPLPESILTLTHSQSSHTFPRIYLKPVFAPLPCTHTTSITLLDANITRMIHQPSAFLALLSPPRGPDNLNWNAGCSGSHGTHHGRRRGH